LYSVGDRLMSKQDWWIDIDKGKTEVFKKKRVPEPVLPVNKY